MPYFPTVEDGRYWCERCDGWFLVGNVSCNVAHSPGSCCHFGERRVSAPTADSVHGPFDHTPRCNTGGCKP